MKKFIVGSLIWFILYFVLTSIIISTFKIEILIYQLIVFMFSMLICNKIAIAITKFLFPESKATSSQKKPNSQDRVIQTNLPLSGTITGPNFELPVDFSLEYEGATKPPIVTHFYDSDDSTYRGFLVNFGNGKVGRLDNTTVSRDIGGRLIFTLKMSGYSISLS